jgi:hypothetical protein
MSVGGPQVKEFSEEEFRSTTFTVLPWGTLLSVYLLWIGLGLLTANRWARWTTIAEASVIAVAGSFELSWDLFHRRPLGALVDVVVPITPAVWTIAYLWTRQVGDWFRLAARLRAEHRLATGVRAGRKNFRAV